jgi:hypothetical protein
METNINDASIQVSEINVSAQDPLKKYKKLYPIFSIIFAILLFVTAFNPIALVIGALIGLFFGHLAIQGIALFKLIKINLTDYSLQKPLTDKALYQHLEKSFNHPDIKTEKGLFGLSTSFIYQNKTCHTVLINEKKNTFSISAKMTRKARIKRGGKSNSATEYRHAVAINPIIIKLVEAAALSEVT